jgi:hypothetical protein
MTCYGTDHGQICLEGIARMFDGCEVVDPEQIAWADDGAWTTEWPVILASLSGLVVFAFIDGTIGAGVAREIGDACDAALPIAVYDPGLGLVELAGIDWLPEDRMSMRRVGSLCLGARIPVAWFLKTREGG